MKCVMVINKELPLGLIANTAAVLAISLGNTVEGIVGEDVFDQDGCVHRGITQVSISMLGGTSDLIRELRGKLLTMDGLYFVDFCDVAQKSKQYSDYTLRLQETPASQLGYLGIAIYGPPEAVNKLTGTLTLLR